MLGLLLFFDVNSFVSRQTSYLFGISFVRKRQNIVIVAYGF